MSGYPLPQVADIDRRGLRDRVYDLLMEMLMSGNIAPGAKLSIDTLAKQLDVSPTPVREAMALLERTGLVTRVALKGYRMAPPLDRQQLTELFEARVVLETAAVRASAGHLEALLPDLREMHRAHLHWAERVVESHAAGTVPIDVTHRYFRADHDFHAAVFAHSGNRYLLQMSESLGALTHRMRQAALRGPQDVTEAVSEHERILAALERGDIEAGERAMQEHIDNVRTRSLADELA